MEILRDGRNQLAEQGIDQWQGDYPNEEHIKEDIEKGFGIPVIASIPLIESFEMERGVRGNGLCP